MSGAAVEVPAVRARRPFRRLTGVPRALPLIWLGLVVVAALVGLVAIGDAANETSAEILAPPSAAHPFGTDELGRDVLERVVVGASVSLRVGLLALLVGLVAGGALGTLAAISGRVMDEVVMRVVDILLSFPAIVLALLVSMLLTPSIVFVSLIIGAVIAPQVARLVRGRLRVELREGYVVAERSTGASLPRILLVHVARNIAPPIAAYALLLLADAILFEAALSFVGVGIQPPQASWGNIILAGQKVLLSDAWWVSVFPGIALFLTIASLNVVADRTVGIAQEELERAHR